MRCESYHIRETCDGYVPVCWGTKEMEECHCGNSRLECTFYPEVRKRAKAAALFHEVYQFFEPHFSGDDKELMDYIAKAIESYKEAK